MASRTWAWEPTTARYRNKPSGRFVSPTTEAKIRDDFNRRRLRDTDALSKKLAAEKISLQQWERDMRKVVEQHWTVQYMSGRGGRNAMTRDDRAELKDLIRGQWDYLRRFAVDISTGRLSAAQIKARSHLYLNDSVRAHSSGRAAAHGVRLPAHPGDGSTICKANCRCHWEIKNEETRFVCYWRRSSGESCPDCRRRARTWAPLTIPITETERAPAWRSVA